MGSPELARDLRALAITTRDLRRRVGREHGRADTRLACLALEIAEGILRYAGHALDPAECDLSRPASTRIDAAERLLGLVGHLLEIR